MKIFSRSFGPSSYALSYIGATAFTLLALTRCGSSTDTTSASTVNANNTTTTAKLTCNTSVQPACPSTPPSYSGAVKTIIATYCLECHDPNGVGAATTGYGAGKPPTNNPNSHFQNPNAAGNGNIGFNDNPTNWDPTQGRDWTVFANITREHVDMMQQVFLCNMPPASATAMEEADRVTLMNWLECGAPNN